MADMVFNTGGTVDRELQVLYLNTGTSTNPTWSPVGKRVEDSSVEMDWNKETKVDIFGKTYSTIKKPVITQTFEPCELDANDVAQLRIWNDAIKDQDIVKMTGYDCLLVHFYANDSGTSVTGKFAERYSETTITPTGLGGQGGGFVGMPIEVTLGGTRTVGTAVKDSSTGAVTFTAAS